MHLSKFFTIKAQLAAQARHFYDGNQTFLVQTLYSTSIAKRVANKSRSYLHFFTKN